MYRQNPKYAIRRYHIAIGFILMVLIFVGRLYLIQVVDSEYKLMADNNAFMRKTLYPSRGMIYDCNDKLIVYNKATTNVMIITRQMEHSTLSIYVIPFILIRLTLMTD